jgi:ADP-heptose:LPS heptosyltransferase
VLRARRYDLAVGVSGLMGGVFAVLSGARWRLGYRDETYRGAYNIPVAGRRYRRPQHEVDYALDLVGALRVTTAVPPDAIAIVGPGVSAPSVTGAFDTGAGRERVTSRSTSVMTRPVLRPPRSSSRPLPPQPYAVLVPGASNGAAKRWPPVYWSQLGDRLARECGLGVVLSGSAGERALAATVDRGMQTRAMNLAGETSVEELTALLAGAAVVVAGDTGPVHLAAALDRPVVGIYGPTDPTNTGPRSPLGVALRLGLTCSPCYDLRTPADCKLPDQSTPCMWGLQPAQVFDAVAALLREAA